MGSRKRLERVYSNDPADGGTSELKIDDRAGTQNTRQVESTASAFGEHDDNGKASGTDMEMALLPASSASMPSPNTRGTVNEMDSAKHRSNHDALINEALDNLHPEHLDLYLNIAEAMNKAPYHVLVDTPAP